MNKKKLIKKIQKAIDLNGDEYTDGEVIDIIQELINKEKK